MAMDTYCGVPATVALDVGTSQDWGFTTFTCDAHFEAMDEYLDHGYATTIHKAQGLTCDHIFVVGPAGLYREAGYVALSRARHTAH